MIDKYRSALSFIDPTNRDTWVKCGMAVKSGLGESGFQIWDSWSRGADNYNRSSALSVWKSIKRSSGITESTLFKFALDAGWNSEEWQHIKAPKIDFNARKKEIEAEDRDLKNKRLMAVKNAEMMLKKCRNNISAYLSSKGFPDMCFNMLMEEGKDPLLCVPMRINGNLSGLQVIAPDGQKKFIYGTNASLATFDIGNGNQVFLCEGLATAFSMQKIASTLKVPYKIRVTFSAGNMAKVAKLHDNCILIADNDSSLTGQRIAIESEKRYYIPSIVGQDVNDECNQSGYFAVSQKIKKILYKVL